MKFAYINNMDVNTAIKTPILTASHAMEIIDLLSKEFDIETPKLIMKAHIYTSADYVNNTIKIDNTKYGYFQYALSMEDIILHEFTHILTWVKNKNDMIKTTGNYYEGYRVRYLHHGKAFQRNLLLVIKAWYKDINKYNWKNEYIAIAKAYKNNKI